MGFVRRFVNALLLRPLSSGDAALGGGVSRRQFLVTVQGAAVGTFLMPGGAASADATGAELTRRIIGRVNKVDLGGQAAYLWTEVGADGKAQVWTWNPETRQEIAEARRFYDATRGVGPDAPEGRRLRRAAAVERSPEEKRYLAAILANPDDDRPYLDYADWLESGHDPYGAYLRVSVALEGMPDSAPEASALNTTRSALLARYGEQWIKPLTDLGFQPEIMGMRFLEFWFTNRGTIPSFTIDRPGILPENAARLFGGAPLLRELHLIDESIDLGRVARVPQMAQIEEIHCFRVTAPQFAAACRSPHLGRLRKLEMFCEADPEPFGEAGGRALAAAPWLAQLEWLVMRSSDLGDEGIRALVTSPGVARLKHLELTNAGDTGVGFAAVATSPHLAGLRELCWSGNRPHPETLALLRDAPFRDELRELDLSHCGHEGLRRDAVEYLAAVRLSRLERFDFGINRLDDGGMAVLLSAPWLAGLRSLDLTATHIGDAEMEELGRFHFPKLERLKLDLNRFGDAGIAALCRGPAWPGLKKLELIQSPDERPDFTPPGPDAARALALTDRFPNLTELHLDRAAIGATGAEALARSPRLEKLTVLGVSEELVGPVGKRALLRRFGDNVVRF